MSRYWGFLCLGLLSMCLLHLFLTGSLWCCCVAPGLVGMLFVSGSPGRCFSTGGCDVRGGGFVGGCWCREGCPIDGIASPPPLRGSGSVPISPLVHIHSCPGSLAPPVFAVCWHHLGAYSSGCPSLHLIVDPEPLQWCLPIPLTPIPVSITLLVPFSSILFGLELVIATTGRCSTQWCGITIEYTTYLLFIYHLLWCS